MYYQLREGVIEDVGAAVFSKLGWDEVERHPFDSLPD